jgi:hypothetical protein
MKPNVLFISEKATFMVRRLSFCETLGIKIKKLQHAENRNVIELIKKHLLTPKKVSNIPPTNILIKPENEAIAESMEFAFSRF